MLKLPEWTHKFLGERRTHESPVLEERRSGRPKLKAVDERLLDAVHELAKTVEVTHNESRK